MEFASLALAFVAGLLTILSPCVLPLLPVVLSTAVSGHRLGPLALVAGLALSFLIVSLFVATIGFSLGVDNDKLGGIAATLLVLLGVVLLIPALQNMVSIAAAPLANWAGRRFSGLAYQGLASQFGLGVLLALVWTPCVGPTLGAASVLAARRSDLAQVALTLLLFAAGTALPLLALGLLSRSGLTRWVRRLRATGASGKLAPG